MKTDCSSGGLAGGRNGAILGQVGKGSVASEWWQAKHNDIYVTYMYEEAATKLNTLYINLKKAS